jgi:hypothetical protein
VITVDGSITASSDTAEKKVRLEGGGGAADLVGVGV